MEALLPGGDSRTISSSDGGFRVDVCGPPHRVAAVRPKLLHLVHGFGFVRWRPTGRFLAGAKALLFEGQGSGHGQHHVVGFKPHLGHVHAEHASCLGPGSGGVHTVHLVSPSAAAPAGWVGPAGVDAFSTARRRLGEHLYRVSLAMPGRLRASTGGVLAAASEVRMVTRFGTYYVANARTVLGAAMATTTAAELEQRLDAHKMPFRLARVVSSRVWGARTTGPPQLPLQPPQEKRQDEAGGRSGIARHAMPAPDGTPPLDDAQIPHPYAGRAATKRASTEARSSQRHTRLFSSFHTALPQAVKARALGALLEALGYARGAPAGDTCDDAYVSVCVVRRGLDYRAELTGPSLELRRGGGLRPVRMLAAPLLPSRHGSALLQDPCQPSTAAAAAAPSAPAVAVAGRLCSASSPPPHLRMTLEMRPPLDPQDGFGAMLQRERLLDVAPPAAGRWVQAAQAQCSSRRHEDDGPPAVPPVFSVAPALK